MPDEKGVSFLSDSAPPTAVVLPKPGELPDHLRQGRARQIARKQSLRARAAAGMTDAEVEGILLSQLSPEHRRVAQLRAQGLRPIQIARVTGYNRQNLYVILARPEVKAAQAWYAKSLHEKVGQVQEMAANALPRVMEKLSAALENPDVDPRHLTSGAQTLGKLMMIGEAKAGDHVRQKIVINLSPDAARQLGVGGVGKLASASPIEWEEVVEIVAETERE